MALGFVVDSLVKFGKVASNLVNLSRLVVGEFKGARGHSFSDVVAKRRWQGESRLNGFTPQLLNQKTGVTINAGKYRAFPRVRNRSYGRDLFIRANPLSGIVRVAE